MKRFVLILSILLWASISWATVSSETMLVQTACNGTTTKYYFTFTIYADTDIKVVSINDTTDVETALTLNSDYTVSVSGKYVTLTAGTKCPSGSTLNLISNVPATQATDFTDGDALSASTLNNALDKLTIIAAQIKGGKTTTVGSPGSDDKYPSERAVRVAISAGGNGDVSGPSVSTDNAIPRFDGTTGKLIQISNATIDDSGSVNIPSGQTYNINGLAHTHAYVSDTAYNESTWDGVTTIAPTKNAVRDKVESVVATIPAKATSAEVATGTDDDKFVTAKAIKDSVNVPNVAPGTSGNVLTSNGSTWTSSTPTGVNSFVAPTLYGVPTAELVIGAAATERSTDSTSYAKLKQITVKKTGTYIVSFQLKAVSSCVAYGRIYVNDVAVGTERESSGGPSYVTYNESISITANDKVQIYAKKNSTCVPYVKNFSIQAHDNNLSTIDTD